jgi:hypothetical protein
MRSNLIVSCLSFLTFGCGSVSDEPNSSVLDNVEAQVVLPRGSEPLSRYSRYYAAGRDGHVEAYYVMHSPGDVDFVRDTCRRLKTNVFPCLPNGNIALVPAGRRKWLSDYRKLPLMHGGGCGGIRFAYDPKTTRFSPLVCNPAY